MVRPALTRPAPGTLQGILAMLEEEEDEQADEEHRAGEEETDAASFLRRQEEPMTGGGARLRAYHLLGSPKSRKRARGSPRTPPPHPSRASARPPSVPPSLAIPRCIARKKTFLTLSPSSVPLIHAFSNVSRQRYPCAEIGARRSLELVLASPRKEARKSVCSCDIVILLYP